MEGIEVTGVNILANLDKLDEESRILTSALLDCLAREIDIEGSVAEKKIALLNLLERGLVKLVNTGDEIKLELVGPAQK